MHPVVNNLVQLQELVLVRDEVKVAADKKRLEKLEKSIDGLAAELPDETRVMFQKLHKKDHTVIIPISKGICAACGLKLPISLVQAVRLAKEIYHCPACARFLYFSLAMPRRMGKGPRRSEPRKAGIARFSAEVLMLPKLKARTKDEAIKEMADLMGAGGFVDDVEKLTDEALRRETLMSTAVDHGLAFPHVRRVEGGGLTLALGISPKGIKFSPGTKQLTRIIFFMVIPTAASAFYLKLLAGLVQSFSITAARKSLAAAKTPKELWKKLIKETRRTVK